ncbi:MAG: YggT family protein [Chloroflexi bacterium]|nr:MAG: YggT family protein [Chloroflexota bacterium]TMG71937.1 MAG: YggT family protein [Chloroflexota bacterium]
MCGTCLLLVFVEALINVLSGALSLAIFARAIEAWIPAARLPFGLDALVVSVTDPLEGPIRRALPRLGEVDFSPFIALLVVQIGATLLLRVLPPAV